MKISLYGLIGLLFVVLGCSLIQTHALTGPTSTPLLEVDVNFKQIAFNINNFKLFTFDPFDELSSFLQYPEIVAYFENAQCQMYDLQTSLYIPSTTILFDVFVHHNTELHCSNMKYTLTPIKDWKVDLTRQDIDDFRLRYIKSTNDITPYPNYRTAMVSTNLDTFIGWALAMLKYHWGPMHPFPTYPSSVDEIQQTNAKDIGIYSFDGKNLSMEESEYLAMHSSAPMIKKTTKDENGQDVEADQTTIFAVTADWGAGTPESQLVSNLMLNHNPDYTINVGDLYLVGSPEDARRNALGIRYSNDTFTNAVKWHPGKLGSLWFQGNHEMYGRGWGYFEDILPAMGFIDPNTGKTQGQATSYRIMESQYWRILFLDSGYTTYSPLIHEDTNPLLPPVMEWLKNVVKLADVKDNRGIVIMLHHDFFSAYGKKGYTTISEQLRTFLGDRVVLTFWGHEHKTTIYSPSNLGGLNTYARCIGTGGFPVDHFASPPNARDADMQAYDNRIFDELEGGPFDVPETHKDTDPYKIPIGYNGYFTLNFTGPRLTVDYYTTQWANRANRELDWKNGHHTMTESFSFDPKTGNIQQTAFKVIDPEITTVSHVNKVREQAQSKNFHIKQPGKLSADKLRSQAAFKERVSKFTNLAEYAKHWENLTFTRNINPEPKYSEESTKEALEKYILAMIESSKMSLEEFMTQDSNAIISSLSPYLEQAALQMIGTGNSRFEEQCPNMIKGSSSISSPGDIDAFEFDLSKTVEIDGHLFPLIKF